MNPPVGKQMDSALKYDLSSKSIVHSSGFKINLNVLYLSAPISNKNGAYNNENTNN